MERIGPRMRELADIVSAMPGITKAEALRRAGLPDRGMGYLRPVNRAIWAGLIIAEQTWRCGPYRLFASEGDQKIWHLRGELMSLAPDAGSRACQIVAQIDRLRQEQAATWTS